MASFVYFVCSLKWPPSRLLQFALAGDQTLLDSAVRTHQCQNPVPVIAGGVDDHCSIGRVAWAYIEASLGQDLHVAVAAKILVAILYPPSSCVTKAICDSSGERRGRAL